MVVGRGVGYNLGSEDCRMTSPRLRKLQQVHDVGCKHRTFKLLESLGFKMWGVSLERLGLMFW